MNRYLKSEKWWLIVCFVLLLVQAASNLALPGEMSDLVNTGVVAMNGQAGQQPYIIGVGIRMLVIALIGVVAAVIVSWLSARIASGVCAKMRRDVFEKTQRFSAAEFDRFSTASLITRTTNDIQQIQNFVGMAIRMIGYALFMGIGGIILAVGTSPSLSWTVGLAVILIVGLIAVIFSIVTPRFTSLQKLVDRLNLIYRESLSGTMVIRAFGNEAHEEQRFDAANVEYTKTNRFVQRVMAFMMPAMTIVMNGISVCIVWAGASAVAASTLPVGDMLAFIQYATQIIMAFLMVSVAFVMMPRAAACAKRIQEVLDTEVSIHDPEEAFEPEQSTGHLEFQNVTFRYPGAQEAVLSDISFTAKPGETTAIIGATGSGKSTLVNLIPRFYDVSKGAVLLDGVDVRQWSQEKLRDCIGYVPQTSVLFSGSIASNLQTGRRDAQEPEMLEAMETAQADNILSGREQGLDSSVIRSGENFSGGQKQRLSIARALVRKPSVYIFDDSFSALDYRTDAKLREALGETTGDATVIIVAQRISTIRNADRIIVLDQGRIAGTGTHTELLDSCPVYRDIAKSQLAKEEVA